MSHFPDFSDDPRSWIRIEVTEGDDRCDVVLHGDVDLATVERLRTVLDDCAAGGSRLVVVDMAEVGFLGVCGLTALHDAHLQLAAAGSQLRVRYLSRFAERLLRLTGLDTVIDVERRDPAASPA